MKKTTLLIILTFISQCFYAQTFNGSTGPISDNNCDVTHDFPVTVSGVGVLGAAKIFNNITFNITHTYDGDLDIYLIAPNGTIVEISTDNGTSGQNYINTIISSCVATASITSGYAPFTGTYAPEGSLGVLNTINADGIWILRVCDDAAQDVGTLNNWSINFGTNNEADYADVSPYTNTINQGNGITVFGKVHKTGLTDVIVGQTPGIQAWVGYSTTNTNPSTWTTWIPAVFNQEVGEYDEYKLILGTSFEPGTYYYATRFTFNNCIYTYGGTNNGFWDGATHNSGILTVNLPAVATNNNCSGATALTVNPDYLCGAVTLGTVYGATASPVDGNSCAGSEDDDVWFSFVATATTHRVSLSNVHGTTTDMFHSLWQGVNCNSLTLVPNTCSDADTSNPTGLVVGQTYYVRVYTVTPNPSQTTTFNVCLGSPPSPPDFVSLSSPVSATIIPGGVVTVYGQIYKTGFTDATSGQTPGLQAWVGYSSTNTNPNTWTNWLPASFNQKVGGNDEYKVVMGSTFAPGTYYYATRFQFTGGGYTFGGINTSAVGNFWDGIVYDNGVLTVNNPIAPGNDNCSGGIPLTMGNVFTDFPLTGNTYGATDSTPVTINCDGNPITVNSSIYYTVVIPASGAVTVETKAAASNTLTNTVLLASVGDCSSLIGMSCNDQNGSSNFSKITLFGQNPGDTLYLTVYKYGSAAPSITEAQFKIAAYTASLGTDTFDSSNFKYYPNPVDKVLNLSGTQEISNVEVFTILGQKISSNNFKSNEIQLDMSALAKGTYLLKVYSNESSKTIRVIKQ